MPPKTDAIMAQLGNRMLRYEFYRAEVTEEELMEYLDDPSCLEREKSHRALANAFIAGFFKANPVSSIPQEDIIIGPELKRKIARLAQLIAHGRVEIASEFEPAKGNEPEFVAGAPEGSFRVAGLLKQLAQGLALDDPIPEVSRC